MRVLTVTWGELVILKHRFGFLHTIDDSEQLFTIIKLL